MLTCSWGNSIWSQYRCRHEQPCPECLHYLWIGKLSYWRRRCSSEQRQFHVYFRCSVMKELQKSIKMQKIGKYTKKTPADQQKISGIFTAITLTTTDPRLCTCTGLLFVLLCFFSYWELKQLAKRTLCHVLFVRQVFDNLRKCFHLISNSRTDVCKTWRHRVIATQTPCAHAWF